MTARPWVAGLAGFALLAGCSAGDSRPAADETGSTSTSSPRQSAQREKPGQPETTSAAPKQSGPAGQSPRAQQFRRQVKAMSVRQLAHQLQVVTVAGTEPHRVSSEERAANMRRFGVRTPAGVARTFRPGGMVYFDQNVRTPQQVRTLSDGLHRASVRVGLPTLLFTDQEGGPVSRLPGPVADGQPAARELGGDPRLARTSARRMGSAMARMGLDADFAPVADVDTVGGEGVIGSRAFGSGPAVVSTMVRQQICGYHRGGVAVSLKHWPGHGSTSVDSHQALPQLSLPLTSWRSQHLAPFAAGVRAGADIVMTGHLAYERLDPSGRPASLSSRMTRGWLRGRLGFDGVIVTDSLSMSAVAAPGTAGRVAVQALRAGADLLLMSPSPTAAAAGIRAAVADGRLTRARLERSAIRVLRLKRDAGLLNRPQRFGRC